MTAALQGKQNWPAEVAEASKLHALKVPIASSWSQLQGVPARLVQDYQIVQVGISDWREWERLEAEQRGK